MLLLVCCVLYQCNSVILIAKLLCTHLVNVPKHFAPFKGSILVMVCYKLFTNIINCYRPSKTTLNRPVDVWSVHESWHNCIINNIQFFAELPKQLNTTYTHNPSATHNVVSPPICSSLLPNPQQGNIFARAHGALFASRTHSGSSATSAYEALLCTVTDQSILSSGTVGDHHRSNPRWHNIGTQY